MQRRWTTIMSGAFALVPTVLLGADLAPLLIGSEHSPVALAAPEPPPEDTVVPLPERPAASRRAMRPGRILQVGGLNSRAQVPAAIAVPAPRPRP